MNKLVAPNDLVAPKVTTGALPASRKVFARPDAAPDLHVPLREIVLSEASGEPPLPVYDTSGPYTDESVTIDVEKGLSRTRVEWVRERGGVESYDGRPIKPVDNGNVSGKHLARAFPAPAQSAALPRPPDRPLPGPSASRHRLPVRRCRPRASCTGPAGVTTRWRAPRRRP